MSLKKFIHFSERVEQYIDPKILSNCLNIDIDAHFEKLSQVPANKIHMRQKLMQEFALKPVRYSLMNVKIAQIAMLNSEAFDHFLTQIACYYHYETWQKIASPEAFKAIDGFLSFEDLKDYGKSLKNPDQPIDNPEAINQSSQHVLKALDETNMAALYNHLESFGRIVFEFWLSHQTKQVKKRFMLLNRGYLAAQHDYSLNFEKISHIIQHINLSNKAIS